MKADDNWHNTRRRIHVSRTRQIIYWLLQNTPIQLRHIEIVLYSFAVLGLLLSIPFIISFFDNFVSLPSWLESVLLITPIEIGSQIAFAPSLLFLLILPAVWYYGTRQTTECPECGTLFTLKYKNTFWNDNGEKTITRTDNEDNPYTVIKYRGKRVHECENCGHVLIESDKWEKMSVV